MSPAQEKDCCASFSKAQEPCTDNEGFSSLLHDDGDGWIMGSDLPPIKYCPWCGKEVRK